MKKNMVETAKLSEKDLRIQEAKAYLLTILKPGDTVNTILRHVSRSGMMRHISVLKDDQDITWHVARLLDDKRADDGGIKCGGCGMNMGFHLVYGLSYRLFKDGFKCSGEGCPANDHSNAPYPKRDGKMKHSDPGYALRHRWL